MRLRLAMIALLGLPLLNGCLADVWEPDVGPLRAGLCKPEDSDPDHEVSFKADILTLLKRPSGQAGCSCHIPMGKRASGFEATGLELSSYRTLMQGGKQSADTIVLPGDPCGSLILQKVSNAPPTGSRMPSDGPPYLTPSERTLLADWIAEGARDN